MIILVIVSIANMGSVRKRMATTKEQVLEFLENADGIHVSGEKLAAEIGVSRNAIWKAVKSLRAEGFDIQAVTNRGYRLVKDTDAPSASCIQHYLPEDHPFNIIVRSLLDSTNAECRRLAMRSAPEGTVVLADEQSHGRGRGGKSFFSPASTGLYLSIIVRPKIKANQSQYLTTMAAVACARAIEKVTARRASIKWVNDVFCDGRKVAGILTETAVSPDSDMLEFAVVGVGVNIRTPENGFPSSISGVAGALFETDCGAIRNRLAAVFLNEFWSLYTELPECTFRKEYCDRCFILGSHVVVKRGDRRLRAKAVDLTENFELVIELPDHTRAALPFGEVSPSTSNMTY